MMCEICGVIDDLEHFFVNCSVVRPLWQKVSRHLSTRLHSEDILFGFKFDEALDGLVDKNLFIMGV